jgi:alpha-glucosidase
MMKRNFFTVIVTLLLTAGMPVRAQYTLDSPDGAISLKVTTDSGLRWSVTYREREIILPSDLSMKFAGSELPAENFRIKRDEITEVNSVVYPVVAHKDAEIEEHYNQLTITFRDKNMIHFRAYNDGVAYAFETDIDGSILVINETANIFFPEGSTSWYPFEDSFMSHNERTFTPVSLDTIADKHLASLPLLVKTAGANILITETGLEDYPGMWIRGAGSNSLKAVFPQYPKSERMIRDRTQMVDERADFLAETEGSRRFPWRTFIITGSDAGLIESNLTFLLADTNRIEDPSWIKPGQVAWDWFNANNIYGVDFRAGLNNDTYKYYIDFAADNGIEYVILDEGWYKLGDLFDISPGFDIAELCSYAESKGVGIILWVVWKTFDDQMERAFRQFSEWGVKGIKVDFMQRDDQKMVQYYYRVAEKAAQYRMLVDFHGSYKPSGLRRTWPNVITREGVKGLENNKWGREVTPRHDVTIPFTRMVAGPMDYTPGAMVNLHPDNFNPMYTRPASQGTRVHQMAMYVVYESPLQMLADNPSNYKREQECTDFITSVPVVWDETRVLDGTIGEFVAIARRSGDNWYVGVMNGNDARDMTLDLSFLEGDYSSVVFRDGINADRYASDYAVNREPTMAEKVLNIKLAPGGGWVALFKKE